MADAPSSITSRVDSPPAPGKGVQSDGQHNDQPNDDLLVVGVDSHHDQSVAQYTNQQRAHDGSTDTASATRQTRPADHHGRNNAKLIAGAGCSLRGAQPRRK